MTELEAVFYGLVQGLTEFLPVSSSGHLALYAALVGGAGAETPLVFSVLVHVASLAAIVIVFRRETVRLFGPDRRQGLFICVATLPAVAAGLLLHDAVEGGLSRPVPVAFFLMFTGGVLVGGEWLARRRRRELIPEQRLTLWQALAVGVAQAVAVLPGVSRSGATISTGRALGLSRDGSVRFAFLLGIPPTAGAGRYEAMKVLKLVAAGEPTGLAFGPAALAFAAALVSSVLALVVLIRVVRRIGLWVFAPYCFLLGVAALVRFM